MYYNNSVNTLLTGEKLKHYAILCGSAPEGKIQKKIDRMYEFLLEENGGLYAKNEIMIFPNGINELNIAWFMNSLRAVGITEIFLYICEKVNFRTV